MTGVVAGIVTVDTTELAALAGMTVDEVRGHIVELIETGYLRALDDGPDGASTYALTLPADSP